jgi:integrase
MLEDYWQDLQLRRVKKDHSRRSHFDRISADLGLERAIAVSPAMVDAWKKQALERGYALGTVNNSVGTLKAALRLAHRNGVLPNVPPLRLLPVRNARQGFFEREEFDAVLAELPPIYQDLARFAYITAAREGEILELRWEHVDRKAGVIKFADTKNGEPRTVPIEGDLVSLIERRWHARKVGDRLVQHVFHQNGRPICFHRRLWRRACEQAGYPEKLFHDLRRTAIRDMVRAGVPETIAMSISGHKTRSVFDRYNISSERDRRAALLRLQAHRAAATQNTDKTRTLGRDVGD